MDIVVGLMGTTILGIVGLVGVWVKRQRDQAEENLFLQREVTAAIEWGRSAAHTAGRCREEMQDLAEQVEELRDICAQMCRKTAETARLCSQGREIELELLSVYNDLEALAREAERQYEEGRCGQPRAIPFPPLFKPAGEGSE